MASQITHIPYGKKALEQLFPSRSVDEKRFFLGTLFPDIRYQAGLKREQTHPQVLSPEKIQVLKNDFDFGIAVHVLVDHEREKYLRKSGIFNLISITPLTNGALKLIED